MPKNSANVSELHRRLVENSPDAICVHEAGRVVYINPTGVQWIGATSANEIVGRPITDFVHPSSIPQMLERISSLSVEGEASQPSEALMVRVDDGAVVVEAVSVKMEWEGRPAFEVVFRNLTAQKAAEKSLRLQAALVEHVSDAIFATNADGVVTSWNPAASSIYRLDAADALGRSVGDVIGAEFDPVAIVASGGVQIQVHRTSDGSMREMRVSAAPMDDGYVMICTDLTAALRAEKHFRTVVSSLDEGVMVLSRTGEIKSMNPAAKRLLAAPDGYNQLHEGARWFGGAMLDRNGRLLAVEDYPMNRLWSTGETQSGFVIGARRSDATVLWLSGSCSLLTPEDPENSLALTSFTDITATRDATRELEFQATHDGLTGLPNRSAVEATIAGALASADASLSVAVLYIDLDKLKGINDSLGHSAGDDVLLLVSERLRRCVRAVDVVGRIGGDEFVAVLIGGMNESEVDLFAERLHSTLAVPAVVDGVSLTLGGSIGVVLTNGADGRSPREILRDADDAMYEAKIAGGGRTSHFDDGTRSRVGRDRRAADVRDPDSGHRTRSRDSTDR